MHLYSGPLILFGRKVEIALREKGVPYTCTMVPFSQTEGYARVKSSGGASTSP